MDPGRLIDEQIAILRELEEGFPIYGVKIPPLTAQTKVSALLDVGEALLAFFAERDWPVLFHVAVSRASVFTGRRHPSGRRTPSRAAFLPGALHRLPPELLERADSLPNM